MQPIFIPKKLCPMKGKPGCELLPMNVLVGRLMKAGKEKRFCVVCYEPDFSTFKVTASSRSPKKISMKYPNPYYPGFWLQISRDEDGNYRCKKYRHGRWIGGAIGGGDNWGQFFFYVGMIGLERGEPCFIEKF